MQVCAQLWYLRLENVCAMAKSGRKNRVSTQEKSDFAITIASETEKG